jgi:hypothetical protein
MLPLASGTWLGRQHNFDHLVDVRKSLLIEFFVLLLCIKVPDLLLVDSVRSHRCGKLMLVVFANRREPYRRVARRGVWGGLLVKDILLRPVLEILGFLILSERLSLARIIRPLVVDDCIVH